MENRIEPTRKAKTEFFNRRDRREPRERRKAGALIAAKMRRGRKKRTKSLTWREDRNYLTANYAKNWKDEDISRGGAEARREKTDLLTTERGIATDGHGLQTRFRTPVK
jgi:hypothetical protein